MFCVPLQVPPPSLLLHTNESLSGWEAHMLDLTTLGVWSQEESSLHISVLEMKAVVLPLAVFLPHLSGESVILMSDNNTGVAYLLWNRGGTVSRILCCMVTEVVLWTRHHFVSLTARNIPKQKKKFANQLSHSNQVLPMEWSLLPRVFQDICKVFGHPHLKSLWHPLQCQAPALLLTSSGPDGLEAECVPAPLEPSVYLCLPAVSLLRQVLLRVLLSTGLLLVLVAPLWPQKEWFADLLSLLVDKPLEPPQA